MMSPTMHIAPYSCRRLEQCVECAEPYSFLAVFQLQFLPLAFLIAEQLLQFSRQTLGWVHLQTDSHGQMTVNTNKKRRRLQRDHLRVPAVISGLAKGERGHVSEHVHSQLLQPVFFYLS